ncbi:NXPE family member 3-like [Ptychodera flava]|uniref:NXPE family member 3-like n=1 Tax=Ptychodera flava TaxID=63121 RepID=UPI003969EB74
MYPVVASQKSFSRVAGQNISADRHTEEGKIISKQKPFTPFLKGFNVISTAKSRPKPGDKFARLLPGGLVPCGPDLQIPISDGVWEDGEKWTSLICMARHWNPDQMIRCARGKSFVIIGDSTTRQWHTAITNELQLELKGSDLRQYSQGITQNISTIFYYHAVAIRSVKMGFWKQHFESDEIDNIKDTQCNSVIVLSISYHFASWAKASYEERLFRVRLAIIRLRNRCPDIIVVVKSSHPRDYRGMEA